MKYEADRAYSMSEIINATKHIAFVTDGLNPFAKNKMQKYVDWRYVAMLLGRQNNFSWSLIGRAMHLDHTSVICGVRKAEKLVHQGDDLFLNRLEMVKNRLVSADNANSEDEWRQIKAIAEMEIVAAQKRLERIREAHVKWRQEAAGIKHNVDIKLEARSLRRKGWSVGALAKRYGVDERKIADEIGETIFYS